MRQFLRWSGMLVASASCLIIFQNCSNSGSLTLEGASKPGPFAHGATPPAGSIASVQLKSGATCPSGTQSLPGSGDLGQLCFAMYSSSSADLVVDVKLQASGAACPSGYDQIASFSGQAF